MIILSWQSACGFVPWMSKATSTTAIRRGGRGTQVAPSCRAGPCIAAHGTDQGGRSHLRSGCAKGCLQSRLSSSRDFSDSAASQASFAVWKCYSLEAECIPIRCELLRGLQGTKEDVCQNLRQDTADKSTFTGGGGMMSGGNKDLLSREASRICIGAIYGL